MPKYSRSRSKSGERKSKRSHKHKDKKHRKHSRSRSKDKKDEIKITNPQLEQAYNESQRRRGERKLESKFDIPDSKVMDQRGEQTNGVNGFDQQQQKKSSRFSDLPMNVPSQNPVQQQTQDQQNDQSSRNFIQVPGQPPRPRKRKNVWTDADENEIKEQLLNEKRQSLDESHPALMIGSNPDLIKNLNPAILNALQDSSKIKKKIYLPKLTGINYIGLLIGPRGLYQKRLEEESGCKILIRGKGSQKEGSAPQPDDEDEQHVLIIGDSTDSVRRATNAIERVISADDTTRNKIREEQLVVAQQINNSVAPAQPMDDSMMTPYGPPSPYAYIIPVPNDCVGLIIGKGGDTIRQLQMESGAKIQVAKKEIADSNLRNVFVEGPPDRYQKAKEMIEEIIREHRRTADPQVHVGDHNPFSGPHNFVKVPDKYVGLIIGKNGDTLKGIAQRSNAKIFVPQKNNDPNAEDRIVEITADPQSLEIAQQEIFSLIERYMNQNNQSSYDYQKNPYGSGIAVYNQQKLSADGQTINGAVPDSLKPESSSYASNYLTNNPMIAYTAMQLTGWSYDDPNNPLPQQQPGDGQDQMQYPGGPPMDPNDPAYQAYYQQYYGGQYQYDPQYAQYYPQQYYEQQPQPTDGTGVPPTAPNQVQNPETDQQQQPASTDPNQVPASGEGGDQQQYTAEQYQQYYQYYYGQGGADPNAYYAQYYQGYEGQPGAQPTGQPSTSNGNDEGQAQQQQQPGQ